MLDQLLRETGAEAEIHVASKHPVEFVEQAVQETQSGLLIVGRSVRHDVFGGPHGDAYAIVRRSPVPVLSV